MTDITREKGKRFAKAFGVFVGVWIAVVGALFMLQAVRIFSLGDEPYTVATVRKYYLQIALPVWVMIISIIANAVLGFVFPQDEGKIKPYRDLKKTLAVLSLKAEITEQMKSKRFQRFVAGVACAVVGAVCVAFAVWYLVSNDFQSTAKSGFFKSHQEAERILRALIWIIFGLIAFTATLYFNEYTVKKEIAIIKEQIAQNAKAGVKLQAKEKPLSFSEKIYQKMPFLTSKGWLLGVRVTLGVAGLALVIIGVWNGGMADVFHKAVNICTQCIGLG